MRWYRLISTNLILFVLIVTIFSPTSAYSTVLIGSPVSQTDSIPPSTALSSPDCNGRTNITAVNNSYEQQVAYLVNVERQKVGKPPYKRNIDLDYAARYHAKDMKDDNYFAHDSYDGWGDGVNGKTYVCSVWTRIQNYYPSPGAENIAAGYGDPTSVMGGWMNSSGHKGNILGGSREIGVGYWTGGYWGSYWVQDFGTRSSVYPLVINLEAEKTDTNQVSLYIYGSGTFTQMQLKNDNDAFGQWQPFQSTLTWLLKPIKGTRTVTVNLKNDAGTVTTTSSDEIYLTSGAVLDNLPASVLFIYNQKESRWIPNSLTLLPMNTGGSMALTWGHSQSQPWITATPDSGSTPNSSLSLSISGLDTSTIHTEDGILTITVTDPGGVDGKNIQVYAAVVANLDNIIFLPIMAR